MCVFFLWAIQFYHLIVAMTSGPIGDNTFNPNIPPPNMPTNALNTPYQNNAQHNQGSSRLKPNQLRVPIGMYILLPIV